MNPIISARQVHFRYDDGTIALQGVDFEMQPGEVVALLGPNGSGKTTFVLSLLGLVPAKGEIHICGIELRKENYREIRRRIGVVFQDAEEQLFLPTVIEDASFGPRNLGLSAADAEHRARHALSQTGMIGAAARAPFHLSAGEKRRVALAGVLAMDPEILILDEPTTYLDPPAQRDLTRLLRDLRQAKLLVTHDVPFARALATRAVFFNKGTIIAQGSVSNIVERFQWELSESDGPG